MNGSPDKLTPFWMPRITGSPFNNFRLFSWHRNLNKSRYKNQTTNKPARFPTSWLLVPMSRPVGSWNSPKFWKRALLPGSHFEWLLGCCWRPTGRFAYLHSLTEQPWTWARSYIIVCANVAGKCQVPRIRVDTKHHVHTLPALGPLGFQEFNMAVRRKFSLIFFLFFRREH